MASQHCHGMVDEFSILVYILRVVGRGGVLVVDIVYKARLPSSWTRKCRRRCCIILRCSSWTRRSPASTTFCLITLITNILVILYIGAVTHDTVTRFNRVWPSRLHPPHRHLLWEGRYALGREYSPLLCLSKADLYIRLSLTGGTWAFVLVR